jgi:pilus assembly protein Flp/PilA
MLLTYIRARIGLAREEGQALVEYALILSLIAVLLVGALTFLHNQIAGIFTSIGNDL